MTAAETEKDSRESLFSPGCPAFRRAAYSDFPLNTGKPLNAP